ncbi:MAG: mycofactocin system FadH/OYE family oxidoreductase 2 [Candidatus Microthrix subdominans]|jgi:mycofactocin system FadH/OYE family oxidoreductase 2|uniref:mycofactocin system FadH/OYE family oxidoreductase 2 n=1 Tax=Candidatus Neomicrothrix sp. TaxID=2719034 RepID=UPI001B5BFCE2|nr:mycofactocin system FadH/OYE family oxidoreductase 2 [Candidatus Microthrix sp.]MBK6310501.1 mycofactocin system FadH/OYE family oxidoreductase 2 [Candidatus Microthrix sp.]MBK6970670.1 mycofactocin system FadH/OYE family oxidoreductase 2 [Candidatus Microthrix sp.]MBP9067353.1 mycofactocin system FadH/OYE family oxidoreductase 2 [Candidatus Microthrix sp.]HMS49481.1 mycofactocin system FadH/OYE family oxidoreductase 2 [Candidatus Microthrix sp.]
MTERLLWSPLRLGPVTVRNRVVFSAHLTNYAVDGRPSPQHVAYYADRAEGGAGLIITEEHSTHPTDWPYEKLIHGFNRDVIPGYKAITEAVHAHRTPIFAQINHNGGQASSMYTRLPVWAPSAVADPLFREVPKAIDQAEIEEIIAGYALVAANCAEGGFDGIELQCSHSSIVRGFLSPATNRRTDGYGGSLANRTRLLLELVVAVRAAIGPDLALGVRLCGDELIEGGTTIDDAIEVAKMVEATGAVDYLNTSIGVATASLFMIEASMHIPPGYASFIPSALREVVDLPVVGVGRFKDPLQAERALTEGHCDLVGVVRGQIADAAFAAKSRAGKVESVRLCLSCNQECVGRMGLNRWLGCIENPRTGRESEGVGDAQPVTLTKRVLVAGGGPAGLQAAIAAARNGHRVTLCERHELTGGAVRLAASVPNRAEFGDLVRNQFAEATRLGVEIETGVELDAAAVIARRPDAVVVATGSRPARPFWAPGDDHRIVDVVDVLTGAASPEGRVLVLDELGFHHATSVAELLADRGCQVEVATPGMVVGQDLGITLDLETWWMRAESKGIVQTTELAPMGWDDGTVSFQHHPTGTMVERSVDWLVLAVPPAPAEELYLDLLEAGVSVQRVGDAVAPRRAHAAVVDGERIGAAL